MMIERIFLTLTVFGVILLASCHGKPLNSNEADARTFLNQANEKLYHFYEEINNGSLLDEFDHREGNKNSSIFLSKIFQDARKFDYKNFKDKELQYAFEQLAQDIGLKIIGKKRFLKLYDFLQEIENLKYEDVIPDFYDSSSEISYDPDVENIIESSNDPKEIQHYWSEWRKQMGEWAEDNLDIPLGAIKKAAELTESTPLDFWTGNGYNIEEMEMLMNNLQPLYVELHAFIRNQLRKKYGESIIAPDGLIPDHLFDQISHQLFTNNRIIADIVPVDNLPSYETHKFSGKELFKIADKFFENIGFEKYPPSFWEEQVKSPDNNDDDDEEEECDFQLTHWSSKIRLQVCNNMNYLQYIDAYSQMSYIYYAKEMAGLPSYYFNYPKALGTGIARALELSAITFHNLNDNKLLADDFKITPEAERNRLLTTAVSYHLLYLPYDFVHAKLMGDLISRKIKKEDINEHYWDLLAKHMGVGPPKDHKSQTLDLPLNFYEEMIDNDMSRDFYTEIMSLQIHKKLCELSGKYPKEPLHLCDINGSKEAGEVLRKMMRLGSSKPFEEVFAIMFPENPKITVDGLLEYYAPIKTFLVEKNKEANVKTGWKSP